MKSEKATQIFLLAAGLVFFLVGIYRGEAATVLSKANIMAFPTTVLVDKDGNIVGEPFMGGIDDQSNYEQLMKQIQSILDQE